MSVEFDIIYGKLIGIGEQLKEMKIDRDFFQQVKVYQNFFDQMMQILNRDDVDVSDYKDRLKEIENNNIDIETRLRKEKAETKTEILKENLKEKIKNQYN